MNSAQVTMRLIFAPFVATCAILVGEIVGVAYVDAAIAAKPAFAQLYRSAFLMTFTNMWIIGVPLHWFIDKTIIQHYVPRSWWTAFPLLIVSQHLLYYAAHYVMHRWWYSIHKYHHRFNEYVVPVSGIAVSHTEFLFAYAAPVILGLIVARPSPHTLAVFLATEYLCTTFVHCGFIESKQHRYVVTPAYHIAHHGKNSQTNLSAPMFTAPDLLFGTQMK